MDSELVKGKPLTREETKFLLELIESSNIITTKTTNATNNKLKNAEWIRLSDIFNATGINCRRTPQQLRLKWENLKKNSRKRSTKIRMNQIKTGGGPPDYIPPDDILDRVTALLGSTASGFTVQFGGDRETAELGVGGGNGDGESSGDGVGGGDARVSVVDSDKDLVAIPLAVDHAPESVVTDYQVLGVVNENVVTPNRRFTFSTPRAGSARKKVKLDENRTARNLAIAEYFTAKKQCTDAKLNNIYLENDSIRLKNTELTLKNEKLLLETKKLKLELKKLKEQ